MQLERRLHSGGRTAPTSRRSCDQQFAQASTRRTLILRVWSETCAASCIERTSEHRSLSTLSCAASSGWISRNVRSAWEHTRPTLLLVFPRLPNALAGSSLRATSAEELDEPRLSYRGSPAACHSFRCSKSQIPIEDGNIRRVAFPCQKGSMRPTQEVRELPRDSGSLHQTSQHVPYAALPVAF